MANTLTTTTTADSTIPEIWSAITADDREEYLAVWPTIDRRYESAANGPYDRIHIQGIGNPAEAAQTLNAGATLNFYAGVVNANVDLDIDTHAYHAFNLEYEADLMSSLPLMQKLASKSAYAVALKMDDDAAALFDNFSQTVGALAEPLDEEDLREAMRILNDAIVPEGDRFVLVSPAQQAHFMGIEKFVNSLYAGAVGNLNVGPNFRGQYGRSHGATHIMSGNVEGTNAAGHDNAMYHREALAGAVIDNMRRAEMYEIDTDSTKVAFHSIYGLIEVRDNHGVWMKGL